MFRSHTTGCTKALKLITFPTFDNIRSEAPPNPMADTIYQVSRSHTTGDILKPSKLITFPNFHHFVSIPKQISITDILPEVSNWHTSEDIPKP